MQSTDAIGWVLQEYAVQRFQLFGATSLADLGAPSERFCRVPGPFIQFLTRYRQPVEQWLGAHVEKHDSEAHMLRFFVRGMLNFLHDKNQFIVIEQQDKVTLHGLYAAFLTDFHRSLRASDSPSKLETELRQVLAVHHADLQMYVSDLALSNGVQLVFSEPVCSEYSPQLQLGVLNTRAEHLVEPILDLGCGPTASLVRYLTQRGKQAVGIDRVTDPDPFTANADWLKFHFGRDRWGTIISHMAFSNHFLHHHLRANGHPEVYARRYMDILRSLKPGGSFFYTPGLPFIESLLPPDAYRVELSPISAAALCAQVDTSVFYACKITRLPSW